MNIEELKQIQEDLEKLQNKYQQQKQDIEEKQRGYERMASNGVSPASGIQEELTKLRSDQWNTLNQINELRKKFEKLSEELKTLEKEEEKTQELPVVNEKENIETLESTTELNIIPNSNGDYKVGDKISLKDAKINGATSFTLEGEENVIITGYFQIGMVAVTDGLTMLDVIKDRSISINSLIEKYKGLDINISVCLDLTDENGKVITKNYAWINSDVLYNNKDKNVENEQSSIEENNEELEKDGTRVGNDIDLSNVNMSSSAILSEGIKSEFLSGNLQIGQIAVMQGSQIIEHIKDNSVSLESILEKYKGRDDIKVSLCVNLLDNNGQVVQKNLGWVDAYDLVPKKVTEENISENIQNDVNTNKINEDNVSVVFVGERGWYEIYYDAEKTKAKIFPINPHLLEKAKYCDYDICLEDALVKFDEEFNTKVKDKYNNGTLNVVYNFTGFNSLRKEYLTSKQRKIFRSMAKRSKKSRNAKFLTIFSNKTVKRLAVTAGLAAVTAGAATGIYNKGIEKNDNNVKTTTESSVPEDDKKDEITTQYPLPPVIDDDPSKDVDYSNKENDPSIEHIHEEITKPGIGEIVEAEESANYRVGDNIDCDNVDLYHQSTDKEPVGNTSKWNFGGYKVAGIAVTDGSSILDVIRNNSISVQDLIIKYEKEYGPGYKISLHIMGLDENGNIINEQLGWVDYNDVSQNKKDVKTK